MVRQINLGLGLIAGVQRNIHLGASDHRSAGHGEVAGGHLAEDHPNVVVVGMNVEIQPVFVADPDAKKGIEDRVRVFQKRAN